MNTHKFCLTACIFVRPRIFIKYSQEIDFTSYPPVTLGLSSEKWQGLADNIIHA